MDDPLIKAGFNVRPRITTNRKQLFPKYNCLPFLFSEKLKIRLCKLGSAFALLNRQLQSLYDACDARWPCNSLRWCISAILDRFQRPYSNMVHHSINLDRHSQNLQRRSFLAWMVKDLISNRYRNCYSNRLCKGMSVHPPVCPSIVTSVGPSVLNTSVQIAKYVEKSS